MTKNNPNIGIKKCEYCHKEFNPPAREDQAATRIYWFCCDSHRALYNMGRRLCESCEKSSRKINQLVCNWCHKNAFKPHKL